MSLVPRTPEEILKIYGTRLEAKIGPNVLQDPVANRSSNLVRIMSISALSVSDVEMAAEARIVSQNPANLEGIALTNYAAQRGIQRKSGTQSKALIVVTGTQGAVLQSGEKLKDRFGAEWTVTEDIVLDGVGIGCSFGHGTACADDIGDSCLENNELTYDTSSSPFIFSATNALLLEVGGEFESDQQLRNRLLDRGPLTNVNGTVDNALSAISAIDGVAFARFEFVDTCIGAGPMFIVQGGEEAKICQTLTEKGGMACNLIGDTQCSACNGIRFQRPCPVLICMNVSLTNDCPISNIDFIRSVILSIVPLVARQTKIRTSDIVNLHPDIDSVTFKIKRPILMGCPEDNAPRYMNPFDGSEIIFGSQSSDGLCGAVSDCEEEQVTNLAEINPWEFFIIDQEQITFSTSPLVETDCVTCS